MTGSIAVAGLADSRLTIIRPGFNTTKSLQLPATVEALSLHPSEPLLAWVDGESGMLRIQTLDGEPLFEVLPPRLASGTSNWISQKFADCYFDVSGDYLWSVAPRGDKTVEVQLYRTRDWSIVGKTKVGDKHGGSSCSFYDARRRGMVCLWLAAGQDGQELYWLTDADDGPSCQREPRLANTTPPAFSPDGSHFVTLHDDGKMRCYESSTLREAGPSVESPIDDDPFAESYCYIDNSHALAGTNNDRIFVVNTSQMRLEGEVAVEGHEPRPMGDYFPSLADEPGLCTDLGWFTRIGDVITFFHRRDGGNDVKGWKDSLLWYQAAVR